MSSYMHFFARSDHDDFIQLDHFSRNNIIYTIVNSNANVSYGAINLIDNQIFKSCAAIAYGYISDAKSNIQHYQNLINQISTFNNDIQDKLNAINDYKATIEDCEQELDEYQFAENFFVMLQNIQAPIYVGIECGSLVTLENIKEE